MNEDKRITQKDVDEASVRLKPVFGVSPGRYLAALYALALLALAFALLVLPGIARHGTVFSLASDPPGAAVFIDGSYAASTPCELFVPSGERTVRVERRGFAAEEFGLRVSGRVFGTALFPRRERLSVSLEAVAADPLAPLRAGMADYAAWSLAGTPSEAYQLPMALSESALDFTAPGNGASAPPAGFAVAALSYANHAVSARDALRAVAVADGLSAALTPASLARLASALTAELSADPAALEALAATLPEEAKAALGKTALYLRASAGSALPPAPAALGRGEAAGVELVYLPAGPASVAAPPSLPARLELGAFALAAAETTVAEYRAFIRENPDWAPERAAALAASGLAAEGYLTGFAEAAPDEPVRYVSRHAAEAYCAWLSRRAPAGYRFALPSEAQWAYAAAAGASAPAAAILWAADRSGPSAVSSLGRDAAGFRGLLGNVWEWTSDSWSAYPAAGSAGRLAFPSIEGVVRGGSWANQEELTSLSSRGPVRTGSCNAYLGFRVALVKIGG